MIRARDRALAEVKADEMAEVKAEIAATISGRLEAAKDFFGQLSILRERASMALECISSDFANDWLFSWISERIPNGSNYSS
jgi:hypothetical protein